MKFSKFNEAFLADGELLIYNHLSKKIVCISKEDYDLANNQINTGFQNSQLLAALINNGIIISRYENEDMIAELRYNDYIYDNILRLVILPNEECNFRCIFCYEQFNNTSMSTETADNLLLYLKKNLTKYAGLNIDWFGGEPLLSMPIINYLSTKLIELCSKIKIPYTSSMTTNGYLLDSKMMNMLLELKINDFQVTLCGLKNEHDSLRYLKNKKGTFDKITFNLLDIKNVMKRRSFKIVLRINVTKNTLEHLPELIYFLDSNLGSDNRFTVYFRPIGDWGGDRVKRISSELDVMKSDIYSLILNIKSSLNFDIYYNLLTGNICASAKRNHYVIRANGDINKCTESLYSDYNCIGRLSNNGFEINNYKLAKWLFSSKTQSFCKECFKYPLCKNRKCPDNILKDSTAVFKYCGYEDLALRETMLLLKKAESKYIYHVKSKVEYGNREERRSV